MTPKYFPINGNYLHVYALLTLILSTNLYDKSYLIIYIIHNKNKYFFFLLYFHDNDAENTIIYNLLYSL